MPKRRKKASRASGGSKAELSKSRGHKPVAVLELFRSKMTRNIDKLNKLIDQRKRSGE